VGATEALVAKAYDAADQEVPNLGFQWESLTPAIATVDASGVVTAVSTGTATIRVRIRGGVGGLEARIDIQVTNPIRYEVTVFPSTGRVFVGQTQLFSTTVRLLGNPPYPPYPTYEGWGSFAPAIATAAAEDVLSGYGVVTGVAPGATSVVARWRLADGRPINGAATVTVDPTPEGEYGFSNPQAQWQNGAGWGDFGPYAWNGGLWTFQVKTLVLRLTPDPANPLAGRYDLSFVSAARCWSCGSNDPRSYNWQPHSSGTSSGTYTMPAQRALNSPEETITFTPDVASPGAMVPLRTFVTAGNTSAITGVFRWRVEGTGGVVDNQAVRLGRR
jgi:hypothetical protein